MRGSRLLVLFVAWWLALAATAALGQPSPSASAGRLVLPEVPQHPVPLRGDWGFAWHRYVDPGWQQLPTQAFAPVPRNWNELAADGKPPGENGWGSYVLQVDCPRGESLALEALGQRTASRTYVNGTLVAQHGTPGQSAADTWAAIHNRMPLTREFACPLRITVHVANFAHRAGGFVRPMAVGTPEALARQRESQVIYAAVLLTGYLLVGLVSLIFFAVRHRERVPLVFGLFCLAMAVYTDMIGERLFLRGLPAQIDWAHYMWVEYLSWVAAMALFFLTLRGLFPQEIHRRMVQAVLGALAVAAVAVLLLPPGVYSYVAVPGQAIAVLVAVYVAAAMLRAQRRTPIDAGVLLAGLLAVLVTFAIDLLLIDAPRPDKKFAPIGFALFMLSPAVVIARRLSHALNAEERSRTLEENARLREDVERMSRHDLKTPLNSILGASRLLRDDPRLNAEQRELADVLQHAGRRMLEMVNLSLGLFRMETGTYDFRPQAVDLREVVNRVLVDLRSYAEANQVALHLQGSDRAPVVVRAEEPLCYSIVANLVKNAIEAAGPLERVTLALLPGHPVVLSVHNPGEVPPEVGGRFFEKYVTSRKSGGTGLGTYSARLMARAQQGDLQMHTSAGDGTTLTLTLPAQRGELPQPRTEPQDERAVLRAVGALPACDVLVVDDDEFTRLVTRRLLPQPPFRVETAPHGLAAAEAMERHWPQYVLLDMEMPHRNGLDTVRWIREQEATRGRPRCRVVMLSGNDDPQTPARALAAGADRFLAKPASRERLLAAILELQDGLPPAAPSPAPAPAAPSATAPAAAEEILVVDPEWAEAFPGFLQGYRATVEGMAQALAAGDREDLHFLAHRLAGGLSAMGLHWGSEQARAIERTAAEGARDALDARIRGLREHLARVRIETA
ncbi:response regulator [Ramlibacter sp. USB13]|uniref:histidine kinase n=1 Tax=Ramlibacter cellulosilyticus TaxID=2764187 RepID=A0A923SC38_9BURK|nr:response regulator [Ramlibacter cellulosilyticus]MBC5783823.1 response regulator [Ramlibacter cellulosilyticus]